MLEIRNSSAMALALASPIDPTLKSLLALRRDQLAEYEDDLISFVIVQPGDPLAAVEKALGFPPLAGVVDGTPFGEPGYAPPFEWAQDHVGYIEAPVIFDDSGAGVVLIVQDHEGVDADLLALLRTYAVPAEDDPADTQRP